MTKFFLALKDSFTTLLNQPNLFLPKLFIALLYSVQILFLPGLTLQAFYAPSIELLNTLIFWIVYLFAVLIIDILVNAMYPFLVKDFFAGKKISLQKAFKKSFKKSLVIVPTVMLVEILFLAVVVILSFPLIIYFVF